MNEMKNKELYALLEIPDNVVDLLVDYESERTQDIPKDIYEQLLLRSEWENGVRELQDYLVDDFAGIKILWEQLNIICSYTYPEYVKRGISLDIFAATMKFCTRFLYEHYRTFGTFKYVWAWWFPRQMSLNEFRIGALEYEFVDEEEKEIAVHIPSDADMRPESIQSSLKQFEQFRRKYFPGWTEIKLTCDTWMLMPQLQDMLDENSNIAAFQKLFEISHIDMDATWYMGWIFPGYEKVDENLPEKTSLQRELKKYLLAGNIFGIAKGYIR